MPQKPETMKAAEETSIAIINELKLDGELPVVLAGLDSILQAIATRAFVMGALWQNARISELMDKTEAPPCPPAS